VLDSCTVCWFTFLWYMIRNITGSYGRFIFSSLRKLYTGFHSNWTNLHSYPQCLRVPFSLHPPQQLMLVFLMIGILTGLRWNLSVLLIYISSMLHIFHVLISDLYIFFWELPVHFTSLVVFGLLIPLVFNFLRCWYILEINFLSDG
jgi:hypothetical protein